MRRLAFIPVVAVLLAGCTSPEKLFIGTWSLSVPNASRYSAKVLARIAQGNTLQVNPDKSFVWSVEGQSMQGKFVLDDKKANFKITSVGGKEVSKSSSPGATSVGFGTVSEDGRTLTFSSQGGEDTGLTFTKSAT